MLAPRHGFVSHIVVTVMPTWQISNYYWYEATYRTWWGRIHQGSKNTARQVAPETKFCTGVFSMELATCHFSDAQSSRVAPRFLENLWIHMVYGVIPTGFTYYSVCWAAYWLPPRKNDLQFDVVCAVHHIAMCRWPIRHTVLINDFLFHRFFLLYMFRMNYSFIIRNTA